MQSERAQRSFRTNAVCDTTNKKRFYLSAFRLLVDEGMMRHIQRCTETEARARLGDDSLPVA